MPNTSVKLNENKHIISINFDAIGKKKNSLYEQYASLTGAQQWDDIPPFVVLTGRNGMGKSHLLGYLAMNLRNLKANLVVREADYRSSTGSTTTPNMRSNDFLKNPAMQNIFVWEVLNTLSFQTSESPASQDMLNGLPQSALNMYRRDESLFQQVISILKSQPSADQIDEVAVRKALETTIVYGVTVDQLSHPLGVLQRVLMEFLNRQSELINYYKKPEQTKALFDMYLTKESMQKSLESYQAFMALQSDYIKYDVFVKRHVEELQGISPVDEFNQILAEINFGYEVFLNPSSQTHSGFELALRKQGVPLVNPVNLSSGEKMILDVMSWQYCFKNMGTEGKQVTEKVDVMLLDEPDKHLDPRSCKTLYKLLDVFVSKGIQVIMTTHRTDTVALADDKAIFTIEKTEEGIVVINPCTKLKAMFRLTPNFRELTNFSIKVYVEAHDDAVLYEAVYRLLSQHSDEARDQNVRGEQPRYSRFTWQLLNNCKIAEPRVLSRRYQLAFHSTATNVQGAGGGTSGVKIAVQRDYHSHQLRKNKLKQGRFFIDPAMEYPFGILDKDLPAKAPVVKDEAEKKAKKDKSAKYKPATQAAGSATATKDNEKVVVSSMPATKKKDEIDSEAILKDRIVKLRRHSIESYLCDPFVLCSVLSEETLKAFTDPPFRELCLDIKTNIHGDQVGLVEKVKKYFEFLMKDIAKLHSNFFPNPDKIELTRARQNALEKKETRFVILSTDKTPIKIEYPYAFLYCQGHALLDTVVKKLSIANLQEELIDGLASADTFCIPVDLVETMLELDKKVREQVRKVNNPLPNQQQGNAAANANSSLPNQSPLHAAAVLADAPDESIHRAVSKADEKVGDIKLRKGLKNKDKFHELLIGNIPAGLVLGEAYDQGDCFFDALAQLVNRINNTDVNSDKYLRSLCHDFYSQNKKLVDEWNGHEFGGIEGQDYYYFVQYTMEECKRDFNNRSPIWGRPNVEGKILCRQLNLEAICVIEILEDPETKTPILSFNLADKDTYKSIDETEAEKWLKNPKIPTIVVEQKSLHFVPLLDNPAVVQKQTVTQTLPGSSFQKFRPN